MAKLGDLYEVQGELVMEWRITDFSSLSEEKDVHYLSPKFYFSGASWELWFYPNGETEYQSEGWISLYLMRMSYGCPVSLKFSLGFKNLDGKSDPSVNLTYNFDRKGCGYGRTKLILKSDLTEKKADLLPSDALTITCTLKSSETNVVAGSLFNRYQDMSANLKEILVKACRTDCKLNFDGRAIGAHRMILETRSPVFAAMFSHDTKENQTGEISIKDVDKSALESILVHMYSGDLDSLTTENALSVYTAADKYDVKDVKEICVEFIIRNLSVDWVCEVIDFAELHQEEKINRRAREYFKENAGKILKSENWKTFAKENHDLGIELLASLVETLLPK